MARSRPRFRTGGINVTTESFAKVLIRPLVTEKGTRLQDESKYLFEVSRTATKGSIQEAIEKTFNVKVKSVNTIRTTMKTKHYGMRKVPGKTHKKAVVTLEPGHKITIFEGL